MAKRTKKGKELKRKLLHKYRLVILNESTFEEKISFKLSRLNVFVTGTLATVFLIALTTLLIAFTDLKEYIPGYDSTALKRQATQLAYDITELEQNITYTNRYLDTMRKVLRGEVTADNIDRDSLFRQFSLDSMIANANLQPSSEDLRLREYVELEDKYNIFEQEDEGADPILFPPINGNLSGTQKFDPSKEHYAVDIAAPKGTAVKSIADGTVLFSEWTSETGYVMIIEHQNGYTSVYKHNGSLIKSQGQTVKAGEVVATVGNTGEFTTGPHLHFELWRNGAALDPEKHIYFK